MRKTGMSEKDAIKLFRKAEKEALTIASQTQLNMVLQAYKAAQQAKAKGEKFSDFKETIATTMKKDWGQDGVRTATLFRETIQSAYSSERREVLNTPQMLRQFPFWQYISVLDRRTTEWCLAYNKTTLPAHHPWWNSHTPPCHFHCRSAIIALTPAQTKASGLTDKPPTKRPMVWKSDDGEVVRFGHVDKHLQVDLRKIPAPFRRSYVEKVARVQEHFRTKEARNARRRKPE